MKKKNEPAPRLYKMVLLAFSLILSNTESMSQSAINVTNKNKEIITQAFAGWKAGTGNFFDLLDDQVSWTITGSTPLSKTYNSKKDFIDQVIDPLNRRFSKRIEPAVRGIYGDGDMVIALWDGVATAIDGKPYLSSYSWYMKMANGKITSVVAFLDGMEFTDILTRIPVNQ